MTDGVPRLSIAPLWRRFVAGIIDAAAWLGSIAAGFLLLMRVPAVAERLRISFSRLKPGAEMPARWRRALLMTSLATSMVGRNWRGPGERLLGVRRVDARTGGPVTVRSALVGFGAQQAWSRIFTRVFAPSQARAEQRMSELGPALKMVEHAYRDDPEAQARAIADFRRAHNLNRFPSCLWRLPPLVVPQLFALWSPRRQSLDERLAGTVVVREEALKTPPRGST